MKGLLHQLKWQFVILAKNNLITISVVVTLVYAAIFYFLRSVEGADQFLILLVYNDPATIGLFFVGLSVIMETDQGVLSALFVTPVNYHALLISRILALSLIGVACAAGMAFAMPGLSVAWGLFLPGVFGTCVIFSFAGIFMVSFTRDFLRFMVQSVPLLIFLSLPVFNFYGLTNVWAFRLLPIQGSLDLIANSFAQQPDMTTVWVGLGTTVLWMVVLYLGIYRIFYRKIVTAG